MLKPEISVVICTHNPRERYFERVISSLKRQSFQHNWELLLIDNASDTNLNETFDISWHSQSRYIREDELGLTPARLRGINEARADLLVFVDDDNVLDFDYLEHVQHISKDFPLLGAWGGQTIPEFESPPPEWTKPYWVSLAIREFDDDCWSSLVNQYETTPCGAGLCIRKPVAEQYAALVEQDTRRRSMGRQGKKLTSFEDSDMAFTACDLGLGTGRFSRLKLTHLMPTERLTEAYLLRLVESSAYSGTIVRSYRGKTTHLSKTKLGRLADLVRFLRMRPRERRFYQARQRGLKSASSELKKQIRIASINSTKCKRSVTTQESQQGLC